MVWRKTTQIYNENNGFRRLWWSNRSQKCQHNSRGVTSIHKVTMNVWNRVKSANISRPSRPFATSVYPLDESIKAKFSIRLHRTEGYTPQLYFNTWNWEQKYASCVIFKENHPLDSNGNITSLPKVEVATGIADRSVQDCPPKAKNDISHWRLCGLIIRITHIWLLWDTQCAGEGNVRTISLQIVAHSA